MNTTTVGQVFLIEDDGTLILPPAETGLTFDSISLEKTYSVFRQTWGDDYDFLACYLDVPSLNIAPPYPGTFYHCVYNDVTGINQYWGDFWNERPFYMNSSRLLGLAHLPKTKFSRTKDVNTYRDLASRYVRLHEMGHQWLATVWFDSGAGPSSELLDPSNLWHWGLKFDCDQSSMSHHQLDWEPDPLDSYKFTERDVTPERNVYAPLDLYLMGMLSPSDPRLSNLCIIDNINPPISSGSGTVHSGNLRIQNVANIINLHGNRVPTATEAQRSFRQAFVLVTKDLNLSEAKPDVGILLAKTIDEERIAHTTEFRSATESRSVLDTYLYSNAYDGIYIKDNDSDTGAEPSGKPFWNSPDIWVRNAEDGGLTHQGTIRNQDNFVYVRIRNKGGQPSGEITANLFQAHWPGTEFLYPEDWRWDTSHFINSKTVATVPAGGSVTISFKWDQNLIALASGWHPCLLVDILPLHPDVAATGRLHSVQANRRIAQKNITIIEPPKRNTWLHFPFVIGSSSLPGRWAWIMIRQSKGKSIPEAAVDLGTDDWADRLDRFEPPEALREEFRINRSLNAGAKGGHVIEQDGRSIFRLSDIRKGGAIALPLIEGERKKLGLRLNWKTNQVSRIAHFEITQVNGQNETVGGVDLVVRARA